MSLANTIVRYARRFCAVHRVGHSVSSPMGAWLVLAMVAQAARDDAREILAEILGLDVDDAAAALDDLLREPPEVVHAALAAWGLAEADWTRRLPPGVDIGPVPDKPALDTWANEHTLGLIPQFPLADTAGVAVLLASALATRATWIEPFDVAAADELRSPWSAALTEVLLDRSSGFLLETADAGLVGVHVARAKDDLIVVSVIGDPGVDRTILLGAAHDTAVAVADRTLRRLSLSDLPLGDHGFLSVVEVTYPGARDQCRSVLPAWEASSDVDLTADPRLGFAEAADVLAGELPFDARQVALARYGRYGFEAAAITYAVAGSAPMFEPNTARVATLRFGHPYAVVSATLGRGEGDPWAGMPVFAAWIETPSDVSAVATGS